MMSKPSPETIDEIGDFGFHNDYETVQLATIALNRFHVLPYPGGFFDQPLDLLYDVFLNLNLSDVTRDKTFYADDDADMYEDQSIEKEIKRLTL